MTKQVYMQFEKKLEKGSFFLNKTPPIINRMPVINRNLDNIVFRCADSFDEYIKAFRLVHDVYVQTGYIEQTPSGLRITPHHANPSSKVFLGIIKSEQQDIPIYTVSVFPDSDKNGLPVDQAFQKELDILRSDGRKIVEVGALASDSCYRKNDMNIPMYGNKMVIRYAIDYLKADDIIIAIHPKHQWFYENIIFFEKIGQVEHYAYVKNNPAVAMRLDLRKMEENFKLAYDNLAEESNLYKFFFKEPSPCILYPLQTSIENPNLLNTLLMYSVFDQAQYLGELNSYHGAQRF